jgi:hypothetical protein
MMFVRVIKNYESGKIWMAAVIAYFIVLSWDFPEETGKTTKTSVY